MKLSLKGKNALVCGGSRGIGQAAAMELAELGATVTLASRDTMALAAAMGKLDQSLEQDHNFVSVNFSNSGDLKRKITSLLANRPIHILVNNTGGPPGGPITEADTVEFVSAFHNHLICNHILTSAVVPGMKKAGFGRIVNIISTSVKQPLSGLGVSNTIRGSVANWAKTMANELGSFGITVNNVLPGATYTDRLKEIIDAKSKKQGIPTDKVEDIMRSAIPAGRFAKPEEVGAAVAFLASPAGAYINGINLPVDGGRTKCL